MKAFLLLPALACLVLTQCAPSYQGRSWSQIDSRLKELTTGHNADLAARKAGKLSKADFERRTKTRFAELDYLERESQMLADAEDAARARRERLSSLPAINSQPITFRPSGTSRAYPSPSSSSFGGSRNLYNDNDTPSYASRSSRSRSTLYESDLSYSKPLGGGLRATDRYGRSTTLERPLGGGYRTTSDSGYKVDWDQNLGGGYSGRDSRGTTWQTEQTLGGNRRVSGSNGKSYTREQTLGGGYRWVED